MFIFIKFDYIRKLFIVKSLSLHTGAVRYAIMLEGDGIKRLYNESQGLYVEVNGNKVLIKGRDFAKKTGYFQKKLYIIENVKKHYFLLLI